MSEWNPWHGCTKISPGCQNCYVYRTDAKFGKDSTIVTKNSDFKLPVKRDKNGNFKLQPNAGTVYTCFTSDFFHKDADIWRREAWQMIGARPDLRFFIITKRIDRFMNCIPFDWENGYENVTIASTAENQAMADYRLPILLSLPIKHKQIICEPLLEDINLLAYLTKEIECVTVGGESGEFARACDYSWVLSIRKQCVEKSIPFHFKQTGANFIKDGKRYRVLRKFQHSQARKADIDT